MMRRKTIRMKVESSTTRTRRLGAEGLSGALHAALRAISAAVDRISSDRPAALPRPAMRGS
jgi:hypothetical protein